MYIRDHMRPAFHKAVGMDPTVYDFKVFRHHQRISPSQVFPVSCSISINPAFRAGLDRLWRLTEARAAAKAQGGLGGRLRRAALALEAAWVFARLFILPVKRSELPKAILLAPSW